MPGRSGGAMAAAPWASKPGPASGGGGVGLKRPLVNMGSEASEGKEDEGRAGEGGDGVGGMGERGSVDGAMGAMEIVEGDEEEEEEDEDEGKGEEKGEGASGGGATAGGGVGLDDEAVALGVSKVEAFMDACRPPKVSGAGSILLRLAITSYCS